MQTATLPYTGAKLDKALDCVLNNRSISLDDYIILIADFSDGGSYKVTSGACNSANGTMKAF